MITIHTAALSPRLCLSSLKWPALRMLLSLLPACKTPTLADNRGYDFPQVPKGDPCSQIKVHDQYSVSPRGR